MDEKGTPMVLMCCHHYKHSDMKHLHMHPPRKPYHNLSPERADQLSHAIVQAATLQTTRSHKFCSSFRTCMLTADWVRFTCFAACVKLSVWAAATNVRSVSGVISIFHP